MAGTMHAKSDSEVTSLDTSSPPRSPRRPLYYVQSPSQHDVEKMSYYGSSPFASPPHPYHCSPIHHSRESSTSRLSASLKNPAAWKRLHRRPPHADDDDSDDDEDDARGSGGHALRCYAACFVLAFVVLFTIFSLILWAASVPYKPKIFVTRMVFHSFNLQAGIDRTGVPTDMLSLNSTVRIFYRNPATFFGVHVTSTPFELFYYQLRLASGHMKKFYVSRKSNHAVVTLVSGSQVPLYGGVPLLSAARDHLKSISVPLNLTLEIRSRAYILGKLVKPKFYRRIMCGVTLKGNHMGKHLDLTNSCIYS